jgi:hypothetical protein
MHSHLQLARPLPRCTHTQAATAEAREADNAIKAARWEADAAARLSAQQLADAQDEAAELRRRLQAAEQQAEARAKELLSEASALRRQLAQQRDEAELAAARAEARAEEAAAAARQRLQHAQGGCVASGEGARVQLVL